MITKANNIDNKSVEYIIVITDLAGHQWKMPWETEGVSEVDQKMAYDVMNGKLPYDQLPVCASESIFLSIGRQAPRMLLDWCLHDEQYAHFLFQAMVDNTQLPGFYGDHANDGGAAADFFRSEMEKRGSDDSLTEVLDYYLSETKFVLGELLIVNGPALLHGLHVYKKEKNNHMVTVQLANAAAGKNIVIEWETKGFVKEHVEAVIEYCNTDKWPDFLQEDVAISKTFNSNDSEFETPCGMFVWAAQYYRNLMATVAQKIVEATCDDFETLYMAITEAFFGRQDNDGLAWWLGQAEEIKKMIAEENYEGLSDFYTPLIVELTPFGSFEIESADEE